MSKNLRNTFSPKEMMTLPFDIMQRTAETFVGFLPGDDIGRSMANAPSEGKSVSGIELPRLAIGPNEEVLIWEVLASAQLFIESETDAYWHVWGRTSDIQREVIDGSFFDTVFPFELATIPGISAWPRPQGGPFNRPPVDSRDTTAPGYSKTQFTFADGSTLVTVGPSIPKLALTKNGTGQLWVTSVGVMTEGTGRFAGALAMAALNGSSFMDPWPDFENPAGRKVLEDGFQVNVSINLKVIRRERLR